jgi:hypothetical protein
MRIEMARKCTNGFYHWTASWGDRIVAYPPCTSECEHKTAEEAERHHYDVELSGLTTHTTDAWYTCEHEGCPHLTNMVLGPPGGMGASSYLCPEHHNKDVFQILHPFVPGRQIWAS